MAAAGFKIKKIASSTSSIGDTLKRSRTRRKISIAEVEEATKIRAKFLLALECDSWDQIPSAVYGRGYLERYAAFLQLSVSDIMAQYDRERLLYDRHCQDVQQSFIPEGTADLRRPLITTRSLVVGLCACLIIAGVGTVVYQVARFTRAPYLQLVTPAQAKTEDSMLVVRASSVEISGRTVSDATVTIDGTQTAVDANGFFSHPVSLVKGVNAVLVQATNAKGKTTAEVLSVVAK